MEPKTNETPEARQERIAQFLNDRGIYPTAKKITAMIAVEDKCREEMEAKIKEAYIDGIITENQLHKILKLIKQ